MNLWVVGLAADGNKWSIIGIFDTGQAAIDACTTRNHFIGPMTLNERLPDELEPFWPGAYYPLGESQEKAID